VIEKCHGTLLSNHFSFMVYVLTKIRTDLVFRPSSASNVRRSFLFLLSHVTTLDIFIQDGTFTHNALYRKEVTQYEFQFLTVHFSFSN